MSFGYGVFDAKNSHDIASGLATIDAKNLSNQFPHQLPYQLSINQ